MRFGQRVKGLRKSRGWSQEDLAERAGLHVTYISGVETGSRNPRLEIVARFADTFSLTLPDLLRFEDEDQ